MTYPEKWELASQEAKVFLSNPSEKGIHPSSKFNIRLNLLHKLIRNFKKYSQLSSKNGSTRKEPLNHLQSVVVSCDLPNLCGN